ncbi:MAG: hypothetical protein U0556_09485 [Dehalococcoidia bacterium]
MQPLELSRLNGTLTWLEDEARQAKAALTRVQTQHDQMLSFLRDYADQLRVTHDQLATLTAKFNQIAHLDEAVKSVEGGVGQYRDALDDLRTATERHRTADQGEVDRLRTILAEAWHRLDALRHEFDPVPGKIQNLGDAQKRIVESVQTATSAHDVLQAEVVQLGQRIQIGVERERRIDERAGDLQLQIDVLKRQDETLTDQLKILSDRVLHNEEQMSAVLAEEEARRLLEEQLHLIRVTTVRVEKLVHDLETRAADQGQQIDEAHRFARQVDDRRASLASRVDEQAETIQRMRDELAELLAEYESLEEQHRVRLVAELQQQIRDVRARIAKARGK